jgi:hypothetical protein
MLVTMAFATILVLSVLVIPSISMAGDYGGGEPKRTTTTTQSSTSDTMTVVAAPEFSGSIDWILFVALVALVLLIRRSQRRD